MPVLVLGGREVTVTGTLLRKILGHPEKPREQLPGQPVWSPARIPPDVPGALGRRKEGTWAGSTGSPMSWVQGTGMRDCEDPETNETLRLITGGAAAGQGAGCGHRWPGVMATWGFPALGIAKRGRG